MTEETYAALVGALVGGAIGGVVSIATAVWFRARERKERLAAIHTAIFGEIELAHWHLTERVRDFDEWSQAVERRGPPHLLPMNLATTIVYDTYAAELAPELSAEDRRGLHRIYGHLRVVNDTLLQLQSPPEGVTTAENFKARLTYARQEALRASDLIAFVFQRNGRTLEKPPAPPSHSVP